MGTRYKTIGDRRVIAVREVVDGVYQIFRGTSLYQAQIGDRDLQACSWATEDAAQAFLDRMAKVRGWRKVK